jgi:hypothetical protein
VAAGERIAISKHSLQHAIQAREKLCGARGIDEVFKIQTNCVTEAVETAAQNARKLGELLVDLPSEIARTYHWAGSSR